VTRSALAALDRVKPPEASRAGAAARSPAAFEAAFSLALESIGQ
jgi:hypothetical protein